MSIYQEMRVAKDECYTTSAESDKLVEYLLNNKAITLETKIWLPFDTDISRIYLSFKAKGFKNIIRTSLAEGLDFYHYEPEEWDVIISNPPFGEQNKIIERSFNLIEQNKIKSFALLLPLSTLETETRANMFQKYEDKISIIIFKKRIKFKGHATSFNTACCWVLYNIPNVKKISWI